MTGDLEAFGAIAARREGEPTLFDGDPFADPEPDPELESRNAEAKKALAEYQESIKTKPPEALKPKPTIEGKAVRLLTEGRVSVVPGRVVAEVVGDNEPHRVEWGDLPGWSCDCEGARFRRTCRHVEAVRRVVRLTTKQWPVVPTEAPF